MKKCVWCDRELKPAPTKLWHITKDFESGICYECVLSLAKLILVSLERETSQPAVEADAEKVPKCCAERTSI